MAKGIKTGGRVKGTVNLKTKEAKDLVVELVEYGLPKAKQKLDEILDPKEYLDALSKYISYVVPKKVDASVKATVNTVDFREDGN